MHLIVIAVQYIFFLYYVSLFTQIDCDFCQNHSELYILVSKFNAGFHKIRQYILVGTVLLCTTIYFGRYCITVFVSDSNQSKVM
jgi:hypothetical protein